MNCLITPGPRVRGELLRKDLIAEVLLKGMLRTVQTAKPAIVRLGFLRPMSEPEIAFLREFCNAYESFSGSKIEIETSENDI